jgi:lipoprotein-releasing system ATP-binding protein
LADLTVLENVLLPSQIPLDSSIPFANAKKILEKVGLEDQLYKRANKISGGQAQRAAIARGLVNNPTIVLADEPTGNLDSVTAQNIVQLMKRMAKELNQTFIVVTHDRRQFGDVDRIITVKDGRVFEGEHTEPMEVTI